ncbi:uncharacterized protein Tco025E_06665 [Trypanosoma conorhini]|uniref:Uncharacterized protein n=1 Tax=Trypanosoma conorhini TaxID=83891 RepID=A0A3R7P1T4_9TRYP|nr:uncharacterized protein Tco025E_06665 [Trypanosoma conorhini]RNF11371.1 hypothetical protein Tco025E_06665 [Trypanosoma conorhini]
MQAKAGKQKPATVALSVTASAAALFAASAQRLTKAHGLLFLALRRAEAGVERRALADLLPPSSVETLLRHGTLGTLKSIATLRRAGQEWAHRRRRPCAAPQPSLPAVLFTLLADMGVSSAAESFSVLGGLLPAAQLCEGEGRPPGSATPRPLHPLTTICINAIEAIAEVTEELPPAAAAAAAREMLRRQRATKRAPTAQDEDEEEEEEGVQRGTGGAAPHPARFFLLSPYAPYAALYGAANQAGDCDSSCVGGEACEVLLAYACPKTAGGPAAASDSPEVWGRLRYQKSNDAEAAAPGTRGGHHEELFFIAATLGDYLRLGSAFAWVYGWQLCYAPQGPPPRSLPWLKLFSPAALAAAISAAL